MFGRTPGPVLLDNLDKPNPAAPREDVPYAPPRRAAFPWRALVPLTLIGAVAAALVVWLLAGWLRDLYQFEFWFQAVVNAAIWIVVVSIAVCVLSIALGLLIRATTITQPGGLKVNIVQQFSLDLGSALGRVMDAYVAHASRPYPTATTLTLTNQQSVPTLPAPSDVDEVDLAVEALAPSSWLPLLNDIDGEPHVLISGKTNSGKSTVAEVLLTLRAQRGDDIYIIDPHYQPVNKYGEITWCGLPGVGGDSWQSVKDALARVLTEYTYRKQEANAGRMPIGGFKPLTVIVDEALETHKTIKKEWEAFQSVMGSGARKYNIFVIANSQSHLIKDIGGSTAQRENFVVVALNEKARDLVQDEAPHAEKAALLEAMRGEQWVAAMVYRGEVLLLNRDGIKRLRSNHLQATMWQPSPLPIQSGSQVKLPSNWQSLDDTARIAYLAAHTNLGTREIRDIVQANQNRVVAVVGTVRKRKSAPSVSSATG